MILPRPHALQDERFRALQVDDVKCRDTVREPFPIDLPQGRAGQENRAPRLGDAPAIRDSIVPATARRSSSVSGIAAAIFATFSGGVKASASR